MSVQSYPRPSQLFQFVSICLHSFTNGTAWSARSQKAVSKRFHLLPKSCKERSRLFRRLHFHHQPKFPVEKPTSSILVVTPRIWYQKMRLSFAVTTSLNFIGKLRHGRSEDQKPTSSPSYRNTSRGFPNSRFPGPNFPKTPPLEPHALRGHNKTLFLFGAQETMELQPKPCPPTASSWFITAFSSFLFGLDFATLLMFIIFSFSVIPPIVFGILFWSLLLAIVFFLRRRDHHCGIDWWWWKTPHKSDPVCSPGTFTHNKVLKPTKPRSIHIPGTYSKTMSFSEYKRRQNKQLQNRIAKPPHRHSFRHPFPSLRRPSSSTYNHKHLHISLLLDSSIMLFPREHPSPAPSLRTRFNCLPPEDVFTFVWDTGCSRSITPDVRDFVDRPHPVPSNSKVLGFGNASVSGIGTVEWVVLDNNRQPYTIRTSALLVPASRTRLLSTQSYLKGTIVFGQVMLFHSDIGGYTADSASRDHFGHPLQCCKQLANHFCCPSSVLGQEQL